MNIHLIADRVTFAHLTASNLQEMDFRVYRLPYRSAMSAVSQQAQPEWNLVEVRDSWPEALKLIECLRSRFPRIGIFVIGAGRDAQAAVEGCTRGANLFVNAPMPQEELMAAVEAHIRWQLPMTEERMPPLGGLELDVSSMQLVGPEATVKLTWSECRLLMGFYSSESRALTTAQICGMFGYVGDYKTKMSVRISRVRQKIARTGIAGKTLVAQPLMGYVLNCPLSVRKASTGASDSYRFDASADSPLHLPAELAKLAGAMPAQSCA